MQHFGLGAFTLGVTAALAARAVAAPLGRWVRPVLRKAVKQGIILSQGAQMRTAGMREDLEDLVAEAREDARRQQQESERPTVSGTTAPPAGQHAAGL
jgi:hypothetical protein